MRHAPGCRRHDNQGAQHPDTRGTQEARSPGGDREREREAAVIDVTIVVDNAADIGRTPKESLPLQPARDRGRNQDKTEHLAPRPLRIGHAELEGMLGKRISRTPEETWSHRPPTGSDIHRSDREHLQDHQDLPVHG